MLVRDRAKWKRFQKANEPTKDDPGYGEAILKYAEAWADAMEVKIAGGAKLEDVAKACEPKGHGITGLAPQLLPRDGSRDRGVQPLQVGAEVPLWSLVASALHMHRLHGLLEVRLQDARGRSVKPEDFEWQLDLVPTGRRFRAFVWVNGKPFVDVADYVLCAYEDGRFFVDRQGVTFASGSGVVGGDPLTVAKETCIKVYELERKYGLLGRD